MNLKTNELTYDIFIVEVNYNDIAQELIVNGFNYDNKHYIYYSIYIKQLLHKIYRVHPILSNNIYCISI